VLAQVGLDRFGEPRAAVLVALAFADHDHVLAAIEVFDPQIQAFQETGRQPPVAWRPQEKTAKVSKLGLTGLPHICILSGAVAG
jgi:hypothetical protein